MRRGADYPKRPTVSNDWLQACEEGSSERKRRDSGLTCSDVSSIATQT